MLFHPSSFIAALLFGLLLVFLSGKPEAFFWVLGLATLLALRNAVATDRRWRAVPEAVFFSLSSVTLLSFVDSLLEQRVFIVAASLCHYLFLLGLVRLRGAPRDETARAFLDIAATVTLFLVFATAYGIYLNFNVPLAGLMLAYGLAAWSMSYWHLRLAAGETEEGRRVLLITAILALVLAELGWAVSLWPFGYLMGGVIVLMFYHALYDLSESAVRRTLSPRRTLSRILLFFLLAAILLVTSRWLPAF